MRRGEIAPERPHMPGVAGSSPASSTKENAGFPRPRVVPFGLGAQIVPNEIVSPTTEIARPGPPTLSWSRTARCLRAPPSRAAADARCCSPPTAESERRPGLRFGRTAGLVGDCSGHFGVKLIGLRDNRRRATVDPIRAAYAD